MTAAAHTFQIVHDPQVPPTGLRGAVYALGNFDGVHRGHKAVIGEALALARQLGKPCAVLTFEPHPADFLAGKRVVEPRRRRRRVHWNGSASTASWC